MGSSGYGRFGTYDVLVGGSSKKEEVECPKKVENIRLEDVATSEYYTNNKNIPPSGSDVSLSKKIHEGRLVVKMSSSQEIIGNLPTQYNYLLSCLNSGIEYSGSIIASGTSPIVFIVVTLNA